MATVVALHGAKGAGKDVFFQIAREAFPQRDLRRVAYADPIRVAAGHILGLTDDSQWDEIKRSTLHVSSSGQVLDGRRVVREIGMLMRHYDQDQFTRYVERTVADNPSAVWVITDLRFANELASVRRVGGVVVKIIRDGATYDGHASETEIADGECDHIIHNTTLAEYRKSIERVVATILESKEHVK